MTKKVRRLKNYVLIGVVCLVIIVLLITGVYGKIDDKAYLANYDMYIKAQENLNQSNYAEAIVLYQQLLEKPRYENSVSIHWGMAQALDKSGNYLESQKHFENIKRIYPAIVFNKKYLQEYGKLLSLLDDSRANKYLERVK